MPNEVEIVVKSRDNSRAGIESARSGTRKLAKDLDDTDKAAKRASGGFGKVGGVIKDLAPSASVAAAAVGAFGLKAAFMASDLSETMSKSKVIFGEGAAEVEKWGATAARAFGLSQQEAVANASSLGDMFSQMGVGGAETLKMSKGIVQLAGDLASFHNADPTAVIEAQTAAFRGEYDALQRFVPTINAAAVQTEALAASGKTNADQLTAAEKATAAYTLMLRGTTAAQGDFARTSDGAANQARILAAEAKDAAAKVGGLLQPALKAAIGAGRATTEAVGGLAGAMADLPAPAKSGALGLIAVMGGAKAAAIAIPAVTGKTQDMVSWLRNVKPASLVAGGALAILGITAGALIGRMEEGKKKARDFLDAINEGAGATTAQKQIEAQMRALGEQRDGLKLTDEQRVQSIILVKQLQTQLDNESKAAQINAGANKDAGQGAKALGEGAEQATTHLNRFGEEVDNVSGKIKDQKSEYERLNGEIDKYNGKNLAGAEASLEFLNSLQGLRESVKDNGRAMSEATQKGRDNREAFIGAAKAAQELSARVADQKGFNAGRASLIESRTRLIALAEQLGLSKAEVDKLAGAILIIPPVHRTAVQLKVEAAMKEAARVRAAIAQVKGKRVDIIVSQNGTVQRVQREISAITGKAVAIQVGVYGAAGSVRGFEHGGIVGAQTGGVHGGLRMVGEAGRELVRLPYGSTVIPHGQTEAMMGAGGGGGQELHIHLRIGNQELGEVILDPLRKVVRDLGGLTATFERG